MARAAASRAARARAEAASRALGRAGPHPRGPGTRRARPRRAAETARPRAGAAPPHPAPNRPEVGRGEGRRRGHRAAAGGHGATTLHALPPIPVFPSPRPRPAAPRPISTSGSGSGSGMRAADYLAHSRALIPWTPGDPASRMKFALASGALVGVGLAPAARPTPTRAPEARANFMRREITLGPGYQRPAVCQVIRSPHPPARARARHLEIRARARARARARKHGDAPEGRVMWSRHARPPHRGRPARRPRRRPPRRPRARVRCSGAPTAPAAPVSSLCAPGALDACERRIGATPAGPDARALVAAYAEARAARDAAARAISRDGL